MLERLFNRRSLFSRTWHKAERSPPVPGVPHNPAHLSRCTRLALILKNSRIFASSAS